MGLVTLPITGGSLISLTVTVARSLAILNAVSPPLVVYDEGGSYSTEVQAMLRGTPHAGDVSGRQPDPFPCQSASGCDRFEGLAPPSAAD